MKTIFGFPQILLTVLLLSLAIVQDSQSKAITDDEQFQDNDEIYTYTDENGEQVDVVLIDVDDDPRGVVLRRWRRLLRSTVFRPGRYFRKILAALVIPGIISGAITGTIASSLVGVGAGGLTGGIAGAGLGGLSGIIVPSVRKKEVVKYSNKAEEFDDDPAALGRDVSQYPAPNQNQANSEAIFFLGRGISVDRLYELRNKMKLLKIKKKFKTKTRHYLWN